MKKTFLIFFLISITLIFGLKAQNFQKYFLDKTLRIDYTHSGNDTTEVIKIGKISMEPYFSGATDQLVSPFNYGKYKVEAYDPLNGNLIYSSGFSTLFDEWQYTDEAKSKFRSFEETLILPFPLKKIRIAFFNRDKQNNYELLSTWFFDPSADSFVKNDVENYPFNNLTFPDHLSILQSRKYHQMMDIVVIPDGYSPADSIKLEEDASKLVKYLLNCKPYDDYGKKISIWLIHCYSRESGVTNPVNKLFKNTIVKSSFNTFNEDRYLMSEDYHHIRSIAANVPYDQIFILVNTEEYGGGGIYNYYSIAAGRNIYAEYLFTHEFGHAFAGLGDEYYTSSVATTGMYNLHAEPWEPNLTTLTNFSQKWENMVETGIPIPTPEIEKYYNKVGAFEGGGYMAQGIFRPYTNCTMKSILVNSFCPVCKRSIIKMLEFYTGNYK